ncbi:MAG: leucyl/phenylalanyl-tRNA--protein transferase [Sphingorhabdus sp.]
MGIDIDLLLKAYAHGIFPMADSREDHEAFWVEPKHRAILPLDRFHISKSLAKTVRQDRFQVTSDKAFGTVIRTCAERVATRQETWINGDIEEAFMTLHQRGMAHSVECWFEGQLVGGLYGLAMGRAFFGESMFSRATDASKVALVWLVARLKIGGFSLLDCQFMTDHLQAFGTIEIRQESYLRLLNKALDPSCQASTVASPSPLVSSSCSGSGAGMDFSGDWGALDRLLSGLSALDASSGASSPGKFILHSLIQTS